MTRLLLLIALLTPTAATATPIQWTFTGTVVGTPGNMQSFNITGQSLALNIAYDTDAFNYGAAACGSDHGLYILGTSAVSMTLGGREYQSMSYVESNALGGYCGDQMGDVVLRPFWTGISTPVAADLDVSAPLWTHFDAPVNSNWLRLPNADTLGALPMSLPSPFSTRLYLADGLTNRGLLADGVLTAATVGTAAQRLSSPPTPVPEPVSLVLFGTGLAWCGWRARR